MGELIYGTDGAPIAVPDDLLAHLRLVVTTKLRRHESFLMSWRHADGSGRSSVWLQPSIPLRFTFDGVAETAIDKALLGRLAASANSNGGLVLDLSEIPRRMEEPSPQETREVPSQPVAQPAA